MTDSKRQTKKKRWQQQTLNFFGALGCLLTVSLGYREWRQSRWDGRSLFAWVEQKENLRVIMVLPEKKQQLIFPLDKDKLVKIGFGFGEYRLGKAFELGELEKNGGRLLTRAAQNYLGIWVNAWTKDKQTNLSQWDKFRLAWFYWFKAGGRSKEIRVVTDDLIHQEIFSEALSAEPISVAVLNASGVDGAAAEVNRLITNLGIEVSYIGNLETEIEKSYLAYQRPEIDNSQTRRALENGLGWKKDNNLDVEKYRSDIVVVIGKDYTVL